MYNRAVLESNNRVDVKPTMPNSGPNISCGHSAVRSCDPGSMPGDRQLSPWAMDGKADGRLGRFDRHKSEPTHGCEPCRQARRRCGNRHMVTRQTFVDNWLGREIPPSEFRSPG
jgi:hypothetical protein